MKAPGLLPRVHTTSSSLDLSPVSRGMTAMMSRYNVSCRVLPCFTLNFVWITTCKLHSYEVKAAVLCFFSVVYNLAEA